MRLTFGDGALLFLSCADRSSHISPRRCLVAAMKHENVQALLSYQKTGVNWSRLIGEQLRVRCESVSGRLTNDQFHLLGLDHRLHLRRCQCT
jgi:hypothetical protein